MPVVTYSTGHTTAKTQPGGLPGTVLAEFWRPPHAADVTADVARMEIPGTMASGQRMAVPFFSLRQGKTGEKKKVKLPLTVQRWSPRRSGTSLFWQRGEADDPSSQKQGTAGFGFGDLRLLFVARVFVVEISHSITSGSFSTTVGSFCLTETIDFRLAIEGMRT